MTQTRFFSNSLWSELKKMASFGAAEGISRGLNWGLMILLPLLLSPVQYGLVGLVIPLIVVGSNILRFGQNRTILRYHSSESDLPSFYFSQLAMWLAITLISVAAIVAFGWAHPATVSGLRIFPHLLLTVIAIATTNIVYLGVTVARAEQNTGKYAQYRLGESILKITFILSLTYFFPLATSFLAGYIMGTGMVGLGVFHTLMNQSSKIFLSKAKRRQYLLFGLPFVFHMIASNLLNFIGRYQVRAYMDVDSVGVFTLATTIGLALTISAGILSVYFEPKIYKQDKDSQASERWLGLFSWTTLVIGSLGSLVALFVLPKLIPGHYPTGYEMAIPLLPTLFSAALLRVFFLQGNFRLALHEKPVWILSVTLVSLAINFSLNRVFIPNRGLDGAILSYFISIFFLSLTLLVISLIATPKGLSGLHTKLAVILVFLCLGVIGLFPDSGFQAWLLGAVSLLAMSGLFSTLPRSTTSSEGAQ